MVPMAYQYDQCFNPTSPTELTDQRVISSQGHRKSTALRMTTHNVSHSLGHARNGTRILQLADRRVMQIIVLFELMMSVKSDTPTQFFKLVYKAGLD